MAAIKAHPSIMFLFPDEVFRSRERGLGQGLGGGPAPVEAEVHGLQTHRAHEPQSKREADGSAFYGTGFLMFLAHYLKVLSQAL